MKIGNIYLVSSLHSKSIIFNEVVSDIRYGIPIKQILLKNIMKNIISDSRLELRFNKY